ncbi:hypothetical protein DL96DRAFT_328715 [Flagelloscypha sp. PMI_526]|nr:hypothetical protein DL96DRAFT_328715 [Flagelloscypha sp. PMI_526]
MLSLKSSLLACYLAPLLVSAVHIDTPGRRHANVTRSLHKRGQEFSLYDGGPVACGGSVSGSDTNTVALSHFLWDGGSHCGQKVTIHAYGKTKTVTIRDECMGCHEGKLDMTRGLFAWFTGGPTDEIGIFPGSWSFGDDEEKKKEEEAQKQKEEEQKKKDEEAAQKKKEEQDKKDKAAAASSSSVAAAKSSSSAAAKSASSSASAATSASTSASVAGAATDAIPTGSFMANANSLLVQIGSLALAGYQA